MKYLITGLGNIGQEYLGTRHNIGFRVVNRLAESQGVSFSEERYGAIARTRVKNCELVLLKPNTFMNLSGNAVRYWLQKENIPIENLLIVVDDIALPFGTLRLKTPGYTKLLAPALRHWQRLSQRRADRLCLGPFP